MYELSIAAKYLRPGWKNLSVSLISLLSISVIALVVWLVVVFFSITHGLERTWISKVVGLSAPLRLTPSDKYFNSYYYRIDSQSAASDFSTKTLGEKLLEPYSDPYDAEVDPELPPNFPAAERHSDGRLRDPVHELLLALAPIAQKTPGWQLNEFLLASARLQLHMWRPAAHFNAHTSPLELGGLTQKVYLAASEAPNSGNRQTPLLLDATPSDWDNALRMALLSEREWLADEPQYIALPIATGQRHWHNFFDAVEVVQLAPTQPFWALPANLRPKQAVWRVCCQLTDSREPLRPLRLVIPHQVAELEALIEQQRQEGWHCVAATLRLDDQLALVQLDTPPGPTFAADELPWLVTKAFTWQVAVDRASVQRAQECDQILFSAKGSLQNTPLQGQIPYRHLSIAAVQLKTDQSTALAAADPLCNGSCDGQSNSASAEEVARLFLPRQFREAGARLADRGYLSYYAAGASSLQEQRLPYVVAGFFDPGLLPIGGRLVLAPKALVQQVRAAVSADEIPMGNGFEVRFTHLENAEELKQHIQQALQGAGLAAHWRIQTFREYDFTKDLLQQLSSERHLFSLLALIILLVACSNIISMLIILVNDKKMEIAILRALGAGALNIALIFGLCGMAMGLIGSVIGIFFATITLKNLNPLVQFLSELQGHQLFNPMFYGEQLPAQLSFEALFFVCAATALFSLLSGIIPAIKAASIAPASALKAE